MKAKALILTGYGSRSKIGAFLISRESRRAKALTLVDYGSLSEFGVFVLILKGEGKF